MQGQYLTTQLNIANRQMPAFGLDHTFAALADPTRRAILVRLAAGEATVNALAQPFTISLPAISRHLTVLERAALIVRRRDGQHRLPARPESTSRGRGVASLPTTFLEREFRPPQRGFARF